MNEAATAPEAAAVDANGAAVLSIEGLHKDFGGIKAVDGASFDVRDGSITALIGPNGAGKTTLFNLVTGFYRPDAGAVTYQGDSIFGRSPNTIAKRGMVRTFQITKALAAMPVIDNMLLAAPHQPGESLPGLLNVVGTRRQRERSRRTPGPCSRRSLWMPRPTTTRAPSRAGSASCWSSRER